MYTTIKIRNRRNAFTLVEMMVVIAIIIALAALAAAFAPRVDDSQKMTRAVDNLEQWLLTAKMRAKRDGLATGLRFIQAPGDTSGMYSQFQYIQQPPPLSGGTLSPTPQPTGAWVPAPSPPFPAGLYLNGGYIALASAGVVTFGNVDFSLSNGLNPQNQWLVQPGDYLEINGGGGYLIASVVPPLAGKPAVQLQLGGTPTYSSTLNVGATATPPTPPITNYRILRQPRILIGEEPLTLPNNYAVAVNSAVTFTSAFGVPDTALNPTCNVSPGFSGYPEILFSPTGAVVGTNASNPLLWISVWDTTMESPDPNRVGIVGIQSRSGFIGAYGVHLGPLPHPPYPQNTYDPVYFVKTARESGL